MITGIAVQTIDPEIERELYPRQLAQNLGLQLADSGIFASTAAPVPTTHRAIAATLEVRIRYDLVQDTPADNATAVAAIEARIIWSDPARKDLAPSANVLAERPLSPTDDPDGIIAVHVAQILYQVGRSLIAKERVRLGGTAALMQVLAAPDAEPDLVLWALALVAEQPRSDLFDAVVTHLDDAEAVVRDQAVQTLVASRDRRAIPHLTRHARFDDHSFLATVVDAVATLGGDEARAYLEFLASGHPDDAIRTRATAALAQLRNTQ